MIEKWKAINKFNNYEISNSGRLRNKKTNKFIKGHINNKGYLRVTLSRKNIHKQIITKKYYMHRLVALYFVNGRNKHRKYVHHMDKNKLNNNYDNLMWLTFEDHILIHLL